MSDGAKDGKGSAEKGDDDDAGTAASIKKEERMRLLGPEAEKAATEVSVKEPQEKLKKRKSSKQLIKVTAEEDTSKDNPTEYFGVRSYLHNFYESVTVKNPQLYEDIYEEEDMAYMSHAKKRRLRFFKGCWRFALIFGGILLLLGLTLLLLGYLMPRLNVVVGYDGDMKILDNDAKEFNELLDLCRIIGLAIFCGGGGILGLSLLLPVLINLQCDDDLGRDNLEPFEIVMAPEELPRSPTDKKVPATEELASIQPKREVEEEMVMTNSGLCKAPGAVKVSSQ